MQLKSSTSRAVTGEGHLIMALNDRSNALGYTTQKRWKLVELQVLEVLFTKNNGYLGTYMPTFHHTGWLFKIKHDPSLLWVKEVVVEKILVSYIYLCGILR